MKTGRKGLPKEVHDLEGTSTVQHMWFELAREVIYFGVGTDFPPKFRGTLPGQTMSKTCDIQVNVTTGDKLDRITTTCKKVTAWSYARC